MGLFSYNRYFKPGKGVEKDEPEKRSFFKFFELFFRKFWKYVEINLLQFLVLLPVIMFIMATLYDYAFTAVAPAVVTDDLKTVEVIESNMQLYAGQTVTGQVLDHGTLESDSEDTEGPGYVSLLLGTLSEAGSITTFTADETETIVTFYLDSEEDLSVYDSTETTDLAADMVVDLTVSEDAAQVRVVAYTDVSTTVLSVEGFNIDVWTLLLQITMLYYTYVPSIIRNILIIVSILAFGPVKAGITYVLRNFSQQQHAWLSDIWDKAKENWKQAMLFGVLDFVILGLCVFDLTYDGAGLIGSTMLTVMKYVAVLIGLIYCIMRKYIYLMMVTVDLKTSALIKNAWLLTFLGSARNFFCTLGNAVLWCLLYVAVILINHLLEFIFPLLMFSLTGFLNVSVCYPLVNKYLVIPIQEMQSQQKGASEEGAPSEMADNETDDLSSSDQGGQESLF